MIYKLIDLPPNVIGFRAIWDVTEKDFEEVLLPSVEIHLQKTKQLNCLLILNNFSDNFIHSTIKILKQLLHWRTIYKRIAIVTESKTSKRIIKFLNVLFPGEFKEFSNSELKEAIVWASENSHKSSSSNYSHKVI